MDRNTSEFYNEMWQDMDHGPSVPDDILIQQADSLPRGRALEMGCGLGANAVWLAEHGWDVTAVDFSDIAIEKARELASEHGIDVNFVVADASEYKPDGEYDLIASFYIQLQPDMRKVMLATAENALAEGGTLLFVSHDKTSVPSEWTEEDRLTLTTPEEVVAGIPSLKIQEARVIKGESGAHTAHMEDSSEANGHEHGPMEFSCTLVRAVKED